MTFILVLPWKETGNSFRSVFETDIIVTNEGKEHKNRRDKPRAYETAIKISLGR
jgi:hypothetical protein